MLVGIWVVDVDVFVFEIVEVLDVGVTMGKYGEYFVLQREYCTDVVHRIFGFEWCSVVEGFELVVGLYDVEVELVIVNVVDVGYVIVVGWCVALDVVFGRVMVEEQDHERKKDKNH